MRTLVSAGPDLVLDVGAHHGQFVLDARAAGCDAAAVSFEPGSKAYAVLSGRVRSLPSWSAVRAAVGRNPGIASLNVAGNAGASSSLLPMLALHQAAAPDAVYIGTEPVEVVRLDDWLHDNRPQARRLALKIDCQGTEQSVLEGLDKRLADVVWLRVELSIRPLYEGSWNWLTASRWLTEQGFHAVGLLPGFSDPSTGEMLQFDGVFTREAQL